MDGPVESLLAPTLFVKSLAVLTVGFLFATNHLYLTFAREMYGIGYISSPWVAAAGAVYLSIGTVLIGLFAIGVPLTFRRAVLVALVCLPAVWFALHYTEFSATGHLLPVEGSTDYTFEDYVLWLPQLLPLALMLPLGATPNQRARNALLGAMGLSLFTVFLQPILSPPSHTFGGVIVPLIYTILVGHGIIVFGSPLYLLGRTEQGQTHPDNQSGSHWTETGSS